MILKRSLMLIGICIVYFILSTSISNFILNNKKETIYGLESDHQSVNEKFITAQILSQSLENVYNILENNLSFSSKDEINKESSMEFLKYITDLMEKYNIKLNQIIPGKKMKKSSITYIPYKLQFICDYEKFGQFLNEIESSDRLILIDDFLVKNNIEKIKSNKDQDISNLEIEMTIETVTIKKSKII